MTFPFPAIVAVDMISLALFAGDALLIAILARRLLGQRPRRFAGC